MAYSDFTLKTAQKAFNLKIVRETGAFSHIQEAPVSDLLASLLEENVPLAVSINTEKARSELIVANVLVEVRKLFDREISLFSGTEFNVDKEKGLTGFCDFIIANSPEQLFVTAPVVTIVEAKNDNIMSGLGQCVSEMVATEIFNLREDREIPKTYGSVTTGTAWKFLSLEKGAVRIDLKDYSIETPGKITGILSAMIRQEA